SEGKGVGRRLSNRAQLSLAVGTAGQGARRSRLPGGVGVVASLLGVGSRRGVAPGPALDERAPGDAARRFRLLDLRSRADLSAALLEDARLPDGRLVLPDSDRCGRRRARHDGRGPRGEAAVDRGLAARGRGRRLGGPGRSRVRPGAGAPGQRGSRRRRALTESRSRGLRRGRPLGPRDLLPAIRPRRHGVGDVSADQRSAVPPIRPAERADGPDRSAGAAPPEDFEHAQIRTPGMDRRRIGVSAARNGSADPCAGSPRRRGLAGDRLDDRVVARAGELRSEARGARGPGSARDADPCQRDRERAADRGRRLAGAGVASLGKEEVRVRRAFSVTAASVLILAAGGVAGGARRASRAAGVTAFVGVSVVPMDREVVLPDQTVIVEGDRISSIAPNGSVPIPAGASRIDASGKYLLPGLIDMHVHVRERDLTAYVANGITSVRNMWGYVALPGIMERVESGALVGPTIYSASPGLDGPPGYWPETQLIDDPARADALVAAQVDAGWLFVKVYQNLRPSVYDAILVAARSRGIRVIGHVPTEVPVEHALDLGQASLEHLHGYDLPITLRNRGPFEPITRTQIDPAKLPDLVELTR